MSATRNRFIAPFVIGMDSDNAISKFFALTSPVTYSSYAWDAANSATTYPIHLPTTFVVSQLWWINGTITSGNVDCGIYTMGGSKIVSTGSTAQSASVVSPQMVDIPDTVLAPGIYLVALAMDNTTGTIYGSASVSSPVYHRAAGVRVQSSGAFPLPNTLSLGTTGHTRMYCCYGMTARTISGAP